MANKKIIFHDVIQVVDNKEGNSSVPHTHLPLEQTETQRRRARENERTKERLLKNAQENANELLYKNYMFFDKETKKDFGNAIANANSVGEINSINMEILEKKFESSGFNDNKKKDIRKYMKKEKEKNIKNYQIKAHGIMNNTETDFFDTEILPLEFLISKRYPIEHRYFRYKTPIHNPEKKKENKNLTVRDAITFNGIVNEEENLNYVLVLSDDVINADLKLKIYNNWEKKSREEIYKLDEEGRKNVFTPSEIRHYAEEYIRNSMSEDYIQNKARQYVEEKYSGDNLSNYQRDEYIKGEASRIRDEVGIVAEASNKINKIRKEIHNKHIKKIDKKMDSTSKNEAVADLAKENRIKPKKNVNVEKLYIDIEEQGTLFIHEFEQLREEILS